MKQNRGHSMVAGRLIGLGAAVLVTSATAASCTRTAEQGTVDVQEHGGGQVVTLWTDSLELFMEHPPLLAGVESEPWAIHLTWMADWQPVQDGTLQLRLVGADGESHVFVAASPARAGIFAPRTLLPRPGRYELALELNAHGKTFPIPGGELEVFETEASLPEAGEAETASLISFLKEQQWEIPFAVTTAEIRQIRSSLSVAGESVAPPDHMARISAAVSGIVAVKGAANVGQRVIAGQTLVILEPTEGSSSYPTLLAETDRLVREFERAERLYSAGAVPERRMIEARHEVDVARARLAGISGPGGANDVPDGSYRFKLRSPIAGIVVERFLTPGQRVQVGEPSFTVVDSRTLWLQLHVPAASAGEASGTTGAAFTVEGGRRNYTTAGLVSVGSVLQPETRTLPVVFRVDNPTGEIKVGMLADGRLFIGEAESGVAVPDEAIREEDGLHVIYVEMGGESFERRVLDRGPGDGEWTIVRRGVKAGERVVIEGAYQVRLASLGEVEAADHGHAH